MEHWKADSEGIAVASEALRQGKLVGMPTETVYGLAGNALDAQAVASIFDVKQRPTFDPLIVHADSMDAALALASSVPAIARHLAEVFWPGPLTLVLPRRADLPDLLSAGLETVALRVPSHPVAHQLLKECGVPLAAPSANRFGRISPTTADHVLEEFTDAPEVAGVLDAGACEMGLESTVVGFPGGDRVVVYRLGATPLEELNDHVDHLEWVRVADAEDNPELAKRGEQSPGMLARHYAPRTPLLLLEQDAEIPDSDAGTGWLSFQGHPGLEGPQEVLSVKGDLREAANRLFGCLRHLDALGLDQLIAWKVPDQGLGAAINDRLTRASLR
ncbi:L-threonylcarbamoyladenylate synthase [Kiritimatiellota bacterium B12222]|nr:L-threonylcarbamoyladenylate synthase [Kiritimatiellota bacterium B12222]